MTCHKCGGLCVRERAPIDMQVVVEYIHCLICGLLEEVGLESHQKIPRRNPGCYQKKETQ